MFFEMAASSSKSRAAKQVLGYASMTSGTTSNDATQIWRCQVLRQMPLQNFRWLLIRQWKICCNSATFLENSRKTSPEWKHYRHKLAWISLLCWKNWTGLYTVYWHPCRMRTILWDLMMFQNLLEREQVVVAVRQNRREKPKKHGKAVQFRFSQMWPRMWLTGGRLGRH